MLTVQSRRRILALVFCLGGVVPLVAAQTTPAPFEDAYQAALARCEKSFERAESVDPKKTIQALRPLAESDADRLKLESLGKALDEMEGLRVPVPAAAPGGDVLDARYKADVLKSAARFSGDGPAALEARRRLLSGAGGGKSAAAAGKDAAAAQAAVERQQGRAAHSTASAQGIARALEQDKRDDGIPAGGSRPAAPASADLRVQDFQPGRHLITRGVPGIGGEKDSAGSPAAAAPPEDPEVTHGWARAKLIASATLGIAAGGLGVVGGGAFVSAGMAICLGGVTCLAGAPAIAAGLYLATRGAVGAGLSARNMYTGKEGPESMLQWAAEKFYPGSERARNVAVAADLATDVSLLFWSGALVHSGKEFVQRIPFKGIPVGPAYLRMSKDVADMGAAAARIGWSDTASGVGNAIYRHFHHEGAKTEQKIPAANPGR
jgi:hypothetical protein